MAFSRLFKAAFDFDVFPKLVLITVAIPHMNIRQTANAINFRDIKTFAIEGAFYQAFFSDTGLNDPALIGTAITVP